MAVAGKGFYSALLRAEARKSNGQHTFSNVLKHAEAAGELRPVHVLAAPLLEVNRLAFRRLQSVNLQLWGLVGCGD